MQSCINRQIYEAIDSSNVGAIEKYVNESNINKGDKNNKNRTYLHYAVEEDKFEAVLILVELGARNNADDDGVTPLNLATGTHIKEYLTKKFPVSISSSSESLNLEFYVGRQYGNIYELNIHLYIYAMIPKVRDQFYYGSNIDDAIPYDDFVFRSRRNGVLKGFFMQIKHSSQPGVITTENILDERKSHLFENIYSQLDTFYKLQEKLINSEHEFLKCNLFEKHCLLIFFTNKTVGECIKSDKDNFLEEEADDLLKQILPGDSKVWKINLSSSELQKVVNGIKPGSEISKLDKNDLEKLIKDFMHCFRIIPNRPSIEEITKHPVINTMSIDIFYKAYFAWLSDTPINSADLAPVQLPVL